MNRLHPLGIGFAGMIAFVAGGIFGLIITVVVLKNVGLM
jgi:hypothetical protein